MHRDEFVLGQLERALRSYVDKFAGDGFEAISAEEALMAYAQEARSGMADPLSVPILESTHGFFLGVDTRRRALREITAIVDAVGASVRMVLRECEVDFREEHLQKPGEYGASDLVHANDALLVNVEKPAFTSIFSPTIANRSNVRRRRPKILILNGLPVQDNGIESLMRHCLSGQGAWPSFSLEELFRLHCERVRHMNSLVVGLFEDPTYTKGEPVDFHVLLKNVFEGSELEFTPAPFQEDPWDYRDIMLIVIDYHQSGDGRGGELTDSPFSLARIAYESTPMDFCFFV